VAALESSFALAFLARVSRDLLTTFNSLVISTHRARKASVGLAAFAGVTGHQGEGQVERLAWRKPSVPGS